MSSMNKLSDLKPDQKNARKHNPRNIGMVANSLREVGAARSGVIDEKGNILAGNGTYEALSEAGIEKVKIVQADGNEWVVVQRKGLSEKQKLKLALYDNRSAELAEWDKEVLADIDPEIMESMFSTDELEDLLDNVGGSEELDGEDDVPEAPEKAISQLGDLYQLGQHRLLCGDSTAKDAVDKLMDGQKADMVFTDPPYNLGFQYNSYDDNQSDSDYKSFCSKWFRNLKGVCEKIIITPGTKNLSMWFSIDSDVQGVGVWVKKNWTTSCKISHLQQWEPILFYGPFKRDRPSDLYEFNRKYQKDVGESHSCPKQIELLEDIFTHYSKSSILDVFGGSGSTLIASEKLNRKCYMMELDPQYCDVIVKRFNGLFPEIEILRNGKEFEPIHE